MHNVQLHKSLNNLVFSYDKICEPANLVRGHLSKEMGTCQQNYKSFHQNDYYQHFRQAHIQYIDSIALKLVLL